MPSLVALSALDVAPEQQKWLSQHWHAVVVLPLRIAAIIVVALLLRVVINRAIKRLIRVSELSTPAMLRPLRDRAKPMLENTSLVSERRRQRTQTIGSVLRSVTSFVIFGVAAMLVLGELGVNLAPILASAGIVGVAIGFGAQNLVKDFLSGLFMVLEDQYGVGDVIDVGEASGTVEAVGLRVTRLRDVYGTVWYVRNGEIIRIGNKSQGYAQTVLDVPMSHQADLEQAGRLMQEAADSLTQEDEWADVILDEPQYLGVEQITADGVILRLTVKTRPGQQWRVGRELRLRIKERFDAADVELASAAGKIFMRTERTGETGQTSHN
jgi:moderate conductance mechanosensitive channel